MTRRDIGVAIAIPEPYGTQLRDWRAELGDRDAVKIPPHVTLLPPTALAAETLDEVCAHLSAVARGQAPFRLVLRGSATFRPVSPVVFVQLVQGIAECTQLEVAVRQGPLDRPLNFAYYPHVTVAHELGEQELDRASRELVDYQAAFDVDAFSLFERGADGHWSPLRAFDLAGLDPDVEAERG